jgi:hypothetical protein
MVVVRLRVLPLVVMAAVGQFVVGVILASVVAVVVVGVGQARHVDLVAD